MNASVSVLTLVRGRKRHLANLLDGVARQTRRPDEVVIAYMQAEMHSDLPDPGCPVGTVFVGGEPMPLAKARNAAAAAAGGDILVFLDVDCIPSDDLVGSYRRAVTAEDGVFMGEVLYLPPGVPAGAIDPAALDRAGEAHPSKPDFPETGWCQEPDHGELWGLSFALRRALWTRLDGMDEGFVGYGGEETDFAARLAADAVPLYRLGRARCWHQHHPVVSPPLDRFAEIVGNARRFHAKWGRWCMEYWLAQFAEIGLITLSADHIRVLRDPTSSELARSQTNNGARFS